MKCVTKLGTQTYLTSEPMPLWNTATGLPPWREGGERGEDHLSVSESVITVDLICCVLLLHVIQYMTVASEVYCESHVWPCVN